MLSLLPCSDAHVADGRYRRSIWRMTAPPFGYSTRIEEPLQVFLRYVPTAGRYRGVQGRRSKTSCTGTRYVSLQYQIAQKSAATGIRRAKALTKATSSRMPRGALHAEGPTSEDRANTENDSVCMRGKESVAGPQF
jgi:hypothetical protein